MEKLLTSEEVAEYLRVDVVTIRRLVNRGELTAYRVAGEFRFVEPDIVDFVKRQRVPAGNKDSKEHFKFFTERARKAMALAVSEARHLGHNYVGTEHILLGLVGERVGIAARVLSDFNVDMEQARTNILALLGQERIPLTSKIKVAISQAEIVVAGRQVALTPRAKKVVELAVKEAQEMGHHYIGTEHLLLGLLHEVDGLAVMALERMGINLQELRAKTLEILKAPESATELPSTQMPVELTEEDVATLTNVEGQSGTCSSCGRINAVNNNFCPGCGKRLIVIQTD